LEADRDKAAIASQAAQAAYEADLRDSQVEALTYQITQRQHELSRLVPPSFKDPKAVDDYHQLQLRSLDDLSQTLRHIDDARASLRLVLATSTGEVISPTSESALALVKTQLVSIQNGLSHNIQLAVPSPDQGSSRSALRALFTTLDAAATDVTKVLESQRAAYEAQVGARTDELNTELRSLRSQLTEAAGRQSALSAQRDLALNTNTVLARNVRDQQIAEAAAGHEVVLASEAGPARRVAQSAVAPMAVGFVLGGALASLLALIAHRAARWGRRTLPSFGSARGIS
jgi:hypothetical protein